MRWSKRPSTGILRVPVALSYAAIMLERGILVELIDFEHIRNGPIKLFISATKVRTGRVRRAKLYYLRELKGKAARLRERE